MLRGFIKFIRIIRVCVISLILMTVLTYAAYSLLDIQSVYKSAEATQQESMAFKPVTIASARSEAAEEISVEATQAPEITPICDTTSAPTAQCTPVQSIQTSSTPLPAATPQSTTTPEPTATPMPTATPRAVVNQSVLDAAAEINEDIVAWLTVDGTKIDYAVVQGEDNLEYLKKNIKGKKADVGSIFMDYRSDKELSDFNTIIYGHKMKSGSMFGMLPRFAKDNFFDENSEGWLYLPYGTYKLDIIAYLVVADDDPIIYSPYIKTQVEKDAFLLYITENAKQYRDVGATSMDQFITLSTCVYDFEGARGILIARATVQEGNGDAA